MIIRTLLLHERPSHRREGRILLQNILRNVSRSFYLSLSVLPGSVRKQVSLAYLFCRVADTIADTQLFPRCKRLQTLRAFRRQFLLDRPSFDDLAQFQATMLPQRARKEDHQLFHHLSDCFHVFEEFSEVDRRLIRDLVLTLTHGMEMDLTYFPGETASTVQALPDLATLDLYTYYVAGVVGEFWTKINKTHIQIWQPQKLQALCALGVRFGKGLQMTNILKDLGKDLSVGRCYLPREQLEQVEVRVEELTKPVVIQRLRPLIIQLTWQTLDHLDQACQYVLQLPHHALRLRLSCMWPLLFAVQTLEEVCQSEELLFPEAHVKISRGAVYRTMFWSLWCLISPGIFAKYYAYMRRRLIGTLHHHTRVDPLGQGIV